jgi:hypothetical protein
MSLWPPHGWNGWMIMSVALIAAFEDFAPEGAEAQF